MAMKNKPLTIFLAALSLLVLFQGSAEAASTLNPLSGNAWDLYVFGNGYVTYDIFNSIKMLMVPAAGSSGFTTLLMLIATVGFVVLAVAAGFDPAKNLLRMFFYILIVWFVVFFTTGVVVNLQIDDVLAPPDNAAPPVQGVPAIVGLPAALISQVGWYFNKSIETYFSVPGEFKLSGAGVGQFDLFNKMLAASTQYKIQDSGIQKSVAAYVSDCVIPAIAMGTFKDAAPPKGATASTGVDALMNTTDYFKTLGTAQNQAIMTTYYPPTLSTPSSSASTPISGSAGMGQVVTCQTAYTNLGTDLQQEANALLTASGDAWSQAGVNTPFETVYGLMLEQSGQSGSPSAGYSKASGSILQNALINSTSPSLRQAALQTGNNAMLQSAALAQAEQSQRSTWVAAFSIFNNMMGYVFTVLQAFIFGITPMVVVALLVPGLGKPIFVNYIQILLWLTLWMPMLGIINYVITLFGMHSAQGIMQNGGMSAFNRALIDEKSNNLIVAAQFLGTMVPLISWGLVKGAMAFTEFINHGIGSSFSSQAGAIASTGNLSLNNMSMDNTSMNKYNTALASTVGTQAVNAFSNAGAMLVHSDGGGSTAGVNGSLIKAEEGFKQGLSKSLSESKAVSEALSSVTSHATSISDVMNKVKGISNSNVRQAVIADLANSAENYIKSHSGSKGDSASESVSKARDLLNQLNTTGGTNVAIGVGTGKLLPGFSANGEATSSGSQSSSDSNKAGDSSKHDHTSQVGTQEGTSSGGGTGRSSSTGEVGATGITSGTGFGHSEQAMLGTVASDALSRQTTITNNLQAMSDVTSSFGMAQGMDFQRASEMTSELNSLRNSMASAEELGQKYRDLTSKATGGSAAAMSAYDDLTKKNTSGYRAAPNPGGYGATAPKAEAFAAAQSGEKGKVETHIKEQTKGILEVKKHLTENENKTAAVAPTTADVWTAGGHQGVVKAKKELSNLKW
jgi:hypothetical protein